MNNKPIQKILIVSSKDFPNELKLIRKICLNYHVNGITNKDSTQVMFCFFDNKDWNKACEEIQLEVGNVCLKPKAKCVIIEKKMKQTFDSNTPPTWFLDFQAMVVEQFKEIKVRLDGIDKRIDNLVKLNKLKE
jgi:hypothetical protein